MKENIEKAFNSLKGTPEYHTVCVPSLAELSSCVHTETHKFVQAYATLLVVLEACMAVLLRTTKGCCFDCCDKFQAMCLVCFYNWV